MARETQKEKIARLESYIKELQEALRDKIKKINEMQDQANQDYANSTDKLQLERQMNLLRLEINSAKLGKQHVEKLLASRDQQIQELKNEIEKNKELPKRIKELEEEIHKLKDENKTLDTAKKKNERGAGRKTKFPAETRQEMKIMHQEGSTIKEIATKYECSVGLVHKLINEK